MRTETFDEPEAYESPLVVLKEGALFYLGDIEAEAEETAAGLYYADTRYLSRLTWRLEGERLTVLSSSIGGGARAHIDLANPDLEVGDTHVPARAIHILATTFVEDALYERLRITSYFAQPIALTLTLRLGADFVDLFEVRGLRSARRGECLTPATSADGARLTYRARDGLLLTTAVAWEPRPTDVQVLPGQEVQAQFAISLRPRERTFVGLSVTAQPATQDSRLSPRPFGRPFARAARRQAESYRAWEHALTRVESDDSRYDALMRQTVRDLRTLTTTYPGEGRIVDAGIPWYVAPFGRDSLITGIESLLLTPAIAQDALRFLAHHQGTKDDPWRDEIPGKILHELRRGEMARLGEVPHTPYYGSADSTAWWIIALAETVRFTADFALVTELKEPLRQAIAAILHETCHEPQPFLTFQRRSPLGLEQQGWKDSRDSVQDENHRLPDPPIAMVEIQGYAYRALIQGADLLQRLGLSEDAQACRVRAVEIRRATLQTFWDPAHERVALAVDGHGTPFWAEASNAGHLLFAGLLPPWIGRIVARSLFRAPMFSGYGIRTLSQSAPYYNPMSYHNGSVWPHDNAIIAWGLRRLRETTPLSNLASALYDAAKHFPDGRLPELFGGFPKRSGTGPVRYPVACDPQAWAVAVPPFLLRLLLGIRVHAHAVTIDHPVLPPWVGSLSLTHLQIAGGELDLEFARHRGVTYANVLRRQGPVRVSIHPV